MILIACLENVKTLPNINEWNTINITNMSYMFDGCYSLLSLPDISKWNTVNVNYIGCMFDGCISLISFPDISKWQKNKLNIIYFNHIPFIYLRKKQ